MAQQLTTDEMRRFASFQENFKRYSAKRKEYRKKYPYEFVAALNGKVILHSKYLPDLLKRLKEDSNVNLSGIILDQL